MFHIIYTYMCVYKVSTHILRLAVRPITLSDCSGRSLEGLAMQWDIKKRVATKTAIHKTDGDIFRSTSSRDLSFASIPSVPWVRCIGHLSFIDLL